MARGRREFGEKLGMTGMPESGAVKNALGDGIGNDCAGPSRDDIADRLTNGGQGGVRTGIVRLTGPSGLSVAGGHDRQCLRKRGDCIFGAYLGELDLMSESLRTVI